MIVRFDHAHHSACLGALLHVFHLFPESLGRRGEGLTRIATCSMNCLAPMGRFPRGAPSRQDT
jgi:hypothetical protein